MKAKDTLFHINWGDNDNFYIVAPDEKTARKRMPDGKDMVNYIVRLDELYQMIFKAGIKEAIEFTQPIMDKIGSLAGDIAGDWTDPRCKCDEIDSIIRQWQNFLKERLDSE